MILDWVFGLLFGLVEAIVNSFPAMPPKPPMFDGVYDFLDKANVLLPIYDLLNALSIFTGAMAAFLVWRIVRALLPGG